MKKKLHFTKIFLTLPLVIAAVWLCGAVFRESPLTGKFPADAFYLHNRTSATLPPFSGEKSEDHHGFHQAVLPANGASAVFSKRNYEPSPPRYRRNGDVGIITGRTILHSAVFRLEKIHAEHLFSFQSFIRHSQPERAGPLMV